MRILRALPARLTAAKVEDFMKKNLTGIVGFLSIFVLITVFTTCDDDNDNNDPVLCKCDPKAHLGIGEDCECGADTGFCDCLLKEYGNIASIPVYREGTISDARMTEIVGIIETTYTDDMSIGDKTFFTNNVIKIIVKPGTILSKDGTVVIIGCDADDFDIACHIADVGAGIKRAIM